MSQDETRRGRCPAKLDLIDRRLLTLLQGDNGKSYDELAEAVYSSRSAVQRRVRRMRRAGIIRGEISLVDPRAVGTLETFMISLTVRDEKGELLQAFCEKVRALNQVQQCYLTTGDANCILVALLNDTEALHVFVSEHFMDNPFVCRFRSHLVTRPIKVGLAVPVE